MSLLTEDEAKRMWCPLARAVDLAGAIPVAANRNRMGADVDCMCIASACMAWRVAKPSTKAVIERTEQEAAENSPAGEGWVVESSGVDQPDEEGPAYAWKKWKRETVPACAAMGFCGAFGPSPVVPYVTRDGEVR